MISHRARRHERWKSSIRIETDRTCRGFAKRKNFCASVFAVEMGLIEDLN